jgi:hypothetical protein
MPFSEVSKAASKLYSNQFREGLDVAFGGTYGERAILGGADFSTHPEGVSVGMKLGSDSYPALPILGR